MIPEVIETNRLLSKRASVEDASELFARYAADPAVARFMPWEPHADMGTTAEFLRRQATEWESGSTYSWTVRLRDTGMMAGMMTSGLSGHRASLGYVLARDMWGQGLATEGAGAVVDFLRQSEGVFRVWATCDVENVASVRVLEKLGFIREGKLHRWDRHHVGAEPRDCWSYAIWRGDDGRWVTA